MKKLLMVVAIGLAAISANAAAYTWKASSGRLFDGLGSDTANRYAGTGYLFNAATVSQADLIAAFVAADGSTSLTELSSALSTGTFSSGRVSTAVAFTGPDSSFDAYFAVFGTDGDGNSAIYISDAGTVTYQSIGESDVVFGQQNAYSSAGFKDAAGGFSSAGWYSSAAAVPEPTSGLLMLLGMAGLALRRRRA